MKRIGNKSYYYQSVREGDRVRSRYLGRGEWAELIDLFRRQAKGRQAEDRELDRERREKSEAEERAIVAWCEAVERVARAALMASGYRQHHRGEWRKRRDQPRED